MREAKPVVLSLANWEGSEEDVGEWIRAVARLSHGTLKIDARGTWRRDEVDSDRATLGDVRAGRVDLAHIPTRAWDTLGVGSFQALDAPMLVDSLALEERVLTSPLGAEMLRAVRHVGVEPVALLPGGCGTRSGSRGTFSARRITAARESG